MIIKYKEINKLINDVDPAGLIAGGAPNDEYDDLVFAIISFTEKNEINIQKITSLFEDYFGVENLQNQEKYNYLIEGLKEIQLKDNRIQETKSELTFENLTNINNQNYIHSDNYKRVNRAGKWAMGIAIFNVLIFFASVLFMNFEASTFDLLLELVINVVIFFFGYRISMMRYAKTSTYFRIIIGIIIFSIIIRLIYGAPAGLSNILMLFIALFGLNAFIELKKDISFSKSLDK